MPLHEVAAKIKPQPGAFFLLRTAERIGGQAEQAGLLFRRYAVTFIPDGDLLEAKNTELIDLLLTFDAVVVAGQAKSHCMAWTIDDLLSDEAAGSRLAERTYLLEDCTSPIVVPGADYTDPADAAFRRYAAASMHVVRSVDPIETWPGLTDRGV